MVDNTIGEIAEFILFNNRGNLDRREMNQRESQPLKSLLDVETGKAVKIVSIAGGKNSRQVLAQLGIGIGSKVTIQRNAPFSGPLLIENHGVSVALGRGIAAKIMVEKL